MWEDQKESVCRSCEGPTSAGTVVKLSDIITVGVRFVRFRASGRTFSHRLLTRKKNSNITYNIAFYMRDSTN